MPPYLYPPLATSLLSYSDICLDPTSSYAIVLSDATEARARLRDALKQAQGNDADWLAVLDNADEGLVQAAQGYLPHVYGLQDLLDADKVLQKGQLAFPWKSALSHDQFGSNSNLRSLPTFASELIFALYAYAIGLCNQAYVVMQSLPSTSSNSSSKKASSQPSMILTTEEEKRKVDKLALAADYLCRAAGVYTHIAGHVLPAWESLVRSCPAASPSHFGGKGKNKIPVECARETANGLAALAMADAHALGIQKLLSSFPTGGAGVPVSLPLPKGHPSPGLLAKLNLHVALLYSSARNSLKTVGTAASAKGDDVAQVDESIAPDLLDYTKKEAALASTRARKWLGVEAGEKGEVGVALAWLKDALDRTETSKAAGFKDRMGRLKIGGSSSGSGDKSSSAADERKDRLSRTAAERKEIERFIDVYKHLNGTVSFQPVPSASSLASAMPSGRPILAAKPFERPSTSSSRGGGASITTQTSRAVDYF